MQIRRFSIKTCNSISGVAEGVTHSCKNWCEENYAKYHRFTSYLPFSWLGCLDCFWSGASINYGVNVYLNTYTFAGIIGEFDYIQW